MSELSNKPSTSGGLNEKKDDKKNMEVTGDVVDADKEEMIHDEEDYFSGYYLALGVLTCILPGGFFIAMLIHKGIQ